MAILYCKAIIPTTKRTACIPGLEEAAGFWGISQRLVAVGKGVEVTVVLMILYLSIVPFRQGLVNWSACKKGIS